MKNEVNAAGDGECAFRIRFNALVFSIRSNSSLGQNVAHLDLSSKGDLLDSGGWSSDYISEKQMFLFASCGQRIQCS